MNPWDIKYIIEVSCIRKKARSKEQADEIVDIKAKQGQLIYYYKCKFCSSYHMTSKQSALNVVEIK